MLAKLIVWAPTRRDAIERMHRALLELTIDGVDTSRDFHLRVMEDEEFRSGDIGIQWLEHRLESLLEAKPPLETERTAAIVAALIADRDRTSGRVGGSSPAAPKADSGQVNNWLRAARLEGLRESF
jgi:acetyl-CoA carboxylase biotin carboxylase subunit